MSLKETDPRLVEAMRENKPPMLRCWINEHSPAALFDDEAHIVVEGIGGERNWSIVTRKKIVYLGISQNGDALGPFRDGYVHVSLFPRLSDDEGYMIALDGPNGDDVWAKVAKDQIIFAQPDDSVWDEIKMRLEKEAEGKTPEFNPLPNDKLAVDITNTGSFVLKDRQS